MSHDEIRYPSHSPTPTQTHQIKTRRLHMNQFKSDMTTHPTLVFDGSLRKQLFPLGLTTQRTQSIGRRYVYQYFESGFRSLVDQEDELVN